MTSRQFLARLAGLVVLCVSLSASAQVPVCSTAGHGYQVCPGSPAVALELQLASKINLTIAAGADYIGVQTVNTNPFAFGASIDAYKIGRARTVSTLAVSGIFALGKPATITVAIVYSTTGEVLTVLMTSAIGPFNIPLNSPDSVTFTFAPVLIPAGAALALEVSLGSAISYTGPVSAVLY